MKKTAKRLAALLTAAACISGVPVPTPAAEPEHSGFAARVYGPGEKNLSSADPYARYQWGLKNDGELRYYEVVNRFRKSMPGLAAAIDFSNSVGITAPVEGPDAYRIETTRSVEGVDINMLPAWQQYDADPGVRRQVIVAVIDTGIDISHPELAGAVWTNEDEIPEDGIDNDGNGYIDDVHGWNFFGNNNQIYVGEEDDHGTHAAGTIAATRGGGGIAGIADQTYVKIMPIKALGTQKGIGEEEAVIAAIRYAEDNGASICNLSFGTREYYPRLEQVMRDSKMLFVTAAGNGDSRGIGIDLDQTADYPTSFYLDNCISVANLMFDGNLERSSNYGAKSVQIAAPGTYIVSTATNGSYAYMTGTSMSAPMVAGAAAFVYSYRTDMSVKDVRDALIYTARKLPGLEGKVVSGGIVDVYAAMNYGR